MGKGGKDLTGIEDAVIGQRPCHEEIPRHHHEDAGAIQCSEAGEVAKRI